MSAGDSQNPVPRSKRRFRWRRAVIGGILLVLVVWLGFYLRSDSFHNYVRRKVVAKLESMTGGKVEIESFDWKIYQLWFEAKGVTVHSRAFAHIDRVVGEAKIISFFRRRIGLRSLVLDHPEIRFIFDANGATGQPPPGAQPEESSPVQPFFDLAIDRLEINNAELFMNDRKVPLAFSGDNFSGDMSYSRANRDYEGNFKVNLATARYHGMGPLQGAVEMHFVMHPEQLEVKSLKFSTGHSQMEAGGVVGNFIHPEANVQYHASLELPELARIAGIPELQQGHLDVNGEATYQNQQYQARGTLAGHNITWRDAGWTFIGVSLASPFSLTPDRISLSALKGSAFGGKAQGEFELVNWNSPPGVKNAPRRGAVRMQLSGMQVSQLADAISTRRLPLNKINLDGEVSGDVNSAWTGTLENAVAQLKLEVDPPANPSPKQLPVTGNFQGAYHRGPEVLDVTALNLATREIRVNATGALGSTTAQLKLAFNANDLREVRPVLAAWSSDAQLPLDIYGRASFNGAVFGRLNAISARGRVDLQDFDTLLGPIHSLVAQNPAARIHWDSMIADVALTPSTLGAENGVLKRGAAQVNFSGTVGLDHGVFNVKTSEFTATLGVQNASLADVQSLSGFSYPVTGLINANLHASGRLDNLRGSGSMTSTKLTVYGEPFTQFRSNVVFAGQETQFNSIVLSHNGAQLTGSAAVNAVARLFRFDLNGSNIELANFSRLEPQRFSMSGRAEFHASGSGTSDAPVVNAQLNVRKLVVNGDLVGDLTASAETHGDNMLLRANTSFQNAIFNLDGSMRLRGDFPAQMTLKFEHLDFDPLIRAYVKAPVTGHSSVQGSIEVRGPIKNPRALSIAANISQLSANLENIKVQNDGPLRFSLNNQAIHIDQFHLTGAETDFSLRGDASLAGTKVLNVNADGKLDLRLAQNFDPNITSSGTAVVAVRLAGTVDQPQVRGRMDISDGAISAVDLPNGLTQVNGRLVFIQDHLEIENLRAHSGGGDLDLRGFIAWRNGLYFDVNATGNDVRVRYPPGLSASASAALHYTGSAQASQLSGNATIMRLAVDPRFDFVQYLARSRNPGKAGTQNPFLENLRLDIHIVSTPELRVETSLAKVAGDADIHIRGTGANPAVLGRVNIAQGDVSFNGTRYHLERGDVTFSNPQLIQPIINVEMAARVRDYDITIGFHGPVDRLNITYRSEPPLPSSDIIALLAFGRTKQEDIYSNQTTTPLTTSDTMLQQALTTASSSRVQKLFGVGSVKIDPQVIGPENNLGPRVTIEQQIQNNITLTYITNVAQSSSEQVIQVEYNVSKSISVVAVRDQNGILAFEVRVKKRKR